MNQEKMVSVIIPTYKSSKYLYQSIYSIVNQSYKNLEIIIIDDTPNDDGTKAILDSFNDKRIIYIKPENKLGMVKSLNYAISLSKGEYIARMDADDISHIERIRLQVEYMEKNPSVGVLGCNCFTIDEKSRTTGCIVHPSNDCEIKAKMMFNVAFIHPSVMIRKKLLLLNSYNEQCFCCEDYELWSRLMSKTEFHNLKQKLFYYRILSNSAMQSQLIKIQTDDEYYKRHTSILKLAYDNVLDYYGYKGSEINANYVDLTFAKRIDRFSLKEKEKFLSKYENIIFEKCNSKYVTRCICYQWIKMTKEKFWKTSNCVWVLGAIKELLIALTQKMIAKFILKIV